MAQDINLQSAGVTTREIDLSGPRTQGPVGIPAGIIGTAQKGPAFVPVTLANVDDFVATFGTTDGKKFGPYAVIEWLRDATAVTYFRVLGIGDGKKRVTAGNNSGKVTNAGFVVGQELPNENSATGAFAPNPHANSGGPPGRMYFLGCFMSESAGSTYLSDAGILEGIPAKASAPIIRGLVMAPSGVVLKLSQSLSGTNRMPLTTVAADETFGPEGGITGSVDFTNGGSQFVMILNGFKGDPEGPLVKNFGTLQRSTVITASFNPEAPNYFAKAFNTDPTKIEEKGHYLYQAFDIPKGHAVVTGSGVIPDATVVNGGNRQDCAFLTTGSAARNLGSTTQPNYENFEDRFATAQTPWFISQRYGSVTHNLFRLVARDDGAYPNKRVKVSVRQITPSTDSANKFGTFDVIVRSFSDNDADQVVLEDSWSGLSLDPSSDRYIAKIIGDQRIKLNLDKNVRNQKLELEGSYPNQSNYIRVELSDKLLDGEVPDDALPVGFRGPDHLITSGSAPLTDSTSGLAGVFATAALKRAVVPPVPYRQTLSVGAGLAAQADPDLHWGIQARLPQSLSQPNDTGKREDNTVASITAYLPNFHTTFANVSTGSNPGQAFSSELGQLDSDKFNNNLFTLENVQIVTASTSDVADLARADEWAYVRNGNITASGDARAFDAAKDLATPTLRNLFKFTTIMQGGFDGVNILNEDMAELSNVAVKAEQDNTNRGLLEGPATSAFNKAITVMKNTSDVDIKLLAIPGIRHAAVTDRALEAVKERFDALYILDVEQRDELNTVITSSAQQVNVKYTVDAFRQRLLDTSFGAAYFPDCEVADELNTNNGNVTVPPSVVVLGAYSLNDRIGQTWFAPAGITRGKTTAIKPLTTLNQDNLDTLYSADVNPLVEPKEQQVGVIVWGQKTLLAANQSLDRVNVRRLLISVRREVRDIANTLLFEPNRASTLARFSALVEPRLASIQQQQGLERFKVVIDTTTTTQADVENNTIRGKIFLQPTKTAEFISLDFVVTNPGTL